MQTPRERIWAGMRALKNGFTRLQVGDACNPVVSQSAIDNYMDDLLAGGFLVKASIGARKPGRGCATEANTYDLAKDQLEAPRVTSGGRISTKGMANLAMWRVMKVLKSFNHREVAVAASQEGLVVKPEAAASYVNALARAGYFTTLKAAHGRDPARFKLAKNTGPHAPVISRRKCVFDRNTAQFAELETAQEVCDGLDE